MSYVDDKRMHEKIAYLGLSAPSVVAGMLQICKELHDSRLLADDAIGRINDAIVRSMAVNCPRSVPVYRYEQDLRGKLAGLIASGDVTPTH